MSNYTNPIGHRAPQLHWLGSMREGGRKTEHHATPEKSVIGNDQSKNTRAVAAKERSRVVLFSNSKTSNKSLEDEVCCHVDGGGIAVSGFMIYEFWLMRATLTCAK